MAERRFVVATAGHVDHGKSTLVRALTGMEPDRFAEERRRGMTIDLGYAWTILPSGAQLAFVDVPGHERFIANMLSGLGPAPAVMFVVAADEGWSRQSEEHLAAVDALQIAHGLLVVTRSDLADPAAALTDSRARLAASSLGEVASVAVSGATGAGVDELRGALDRLLASMPAPDDDAAVRLWLDRSFSVRGAGTVVTGTLAAGAIAVGDTLDLRGRPVSVRGLQSTGTTQQRLTGTARVAINVRGIDSDDVGRGDVLLTPNRWHLTDSVDVRLHSTCDELPAQLTLHVGSAAVPVRVRPLGARHARLALSRSLPLRAGDRAVLRDPGRHAVVAGVLVLDADPPELARRGAAADRRRALAGLGVPPDVTVELARRGAVRREHLERLGVDTTTVADDNGWLVAPRLREQWVSGARAAVSAWAAQRPLDPAMPRAALRRAIGLPDDALLDLVVKEAELSETDGRVTLPGRGGPSFGAADAAIRELVAALAAQPFAAPESDELLRLKLGNRELTAAARAGVLLRLGDVVLLPDAPPRAAALLRQLPQPFTTSQAREALGATRRIAIPLLEHLDALGLTERVSPTHRRVV